jgi:trans-2,3-dihydro-3-hydroxyanthranilate isomerase
MKPERMLGKSLIGNPGTEGAPAGEREADKAGRTAPGAGKGHRFFIVDVFGEGRYSGNQLAVVLPSGKMGTEEMQRIALEFNFPETTFILGARARKGAWPVRIFTPRREVPFAGHPTLGTAHVIRKLFADPGTEGITLDLKAGRIPVRFESGRSPRLWMTQLPPVFGKIHEPAALAKVLGLAAKDFDRRFPIQQVSTGMEFLLVPLKNLAAVRKARTDQAAYRKYFGARGGLPVFLFSPETYDRANRINARMFADCFGIPEDPATGSANGCLAGYLVEHAYFGEGPVRISVEQGYEMGRKSLLHLDARYADGSDGGSAKAGKRGVGKGEGPIEVQVGGKVFEVAEGRLI